MRILDDLRDFASSGLATPLSLAIGNFDGIHAGHQEILAKVKASAAASGGTASVLMFRRHPRHILQPEAETPLLTSIYQRLHFFERAGIGLCFLLSFTSDFSKIDAETFVRFWLVKTLRIRDVYLGYNARFGRGREGDTALMRRLSAEEKFGFREQEPVYAAGDVVSSTRIRALIREGRLEEAAQCLRRPFSVFATVVRGAGRGRKIGFPTANFQVSNEIMPPLGVYPVKLREVTIEYASSHPRPGADFRTRLGKEFSGVLNYGIRPTFGEKEARAVPEVYVLDFEGDLYGRTFEISFYPRLRGETAFPSVEALIQQIEKDIQGVRKLFDLPPSTAPMSGRPAT